MIGFMEKQGKYSVTTFESFKRALKGSYGDMSLKWNAALAMFLTSDPGEQEAWIQRLIAAKRTAGAKTTLERVRELSQQEGDRGQGGLGGQPAYLQGPGGSPKGSGGGATAAELEEAAMRELADSGKAPATKPSRRPRRSAGR